MIKKINKINLTFWNATLLNINQYIFKGVYQFFCLRKLYD